MRETSISLNENYLTKSIKEIKIWMLFWETWQCYQSLVWLLTVDRELCPCLQFLMLSQSSVPDCAPVIITLQLSMSHISLYLYTAPSVFLCGMMVSTLRLSSSLVAPSTRLASSSWAWPSLNHLIMGGGDPPRLEQVRFRGLPSVATGLGGEILGGEGCSNTVRPMLLVCRVFPVPASFTMQLKKPLSRS